MERMIARQTLAAFCFDYAQKWDRLYGAVLCATFYGDSQRASLVTTAARMGS